MSHRSRAQSPHGTYCFAAPLSSTSSLLAHFPVLQALSPLAPFLPPPPAGGDSVCCWAPEIRAAAQAQVQKHACQAAQPLEHVLRGPVLESAATIQPVQKPSCLALPSNACCCQGRDPAQKRACRNAGRISRNFLPQDAAK